VSEEKLLSVIIPSYNHAKLLPRAVHSVLAHADSRVELIVVDDGSEDDTAEVLKQLSSDYNGRLIAIQQSNQGPAATRNHAVQQAQGDFILPLDADDELLTEALPALLTQLAERPDNCFWLAAHQAMDEDGKLRQYPSGDIPNNLIERLDAWLLHKRISICHGACVFKREWLLQNPYPNLPSAEDLPVFARALLAPQIALLNFPLARIHKSANSRRHDIRAAEKQGLSLVDEVFRALPDSVQTLKPRYFTQCCLSLFRTCYLAGEYQKAQVFYQQALKSHWQVVFKFSYTRKALRVWLSLK